MTDQDNQIDRVLGVALAFIVIIFIGASAVLSIIFFDMGVQSATESIGSGEKVVVPLEVNRYGNPTSWDLVKKEDE